MLGLLRYKFSNREEFISELDKYDVDEEIRNNLMKELDKGTFSIIYLSRIGVIKKNQDINVGQIISNFFEFIIKRRRERTFIYVKVMEKYKDFLAPSYDIVARSKEKKWGNYYLASKLLDFDLWMLAK